VKKLKLIALIAAVITALLLYLFLNSLKGGPQADVLKAAVNIPVNTKVSAEMVTLTKTPKEAVHPDAVKEKRPSLTFLPVSRF